MKRKKMQIPDITKQQWNDREKASIFEWLREYFMYRAVFGKSIITYNEDFFIFAIKFLEEEIDGGEVNKEDAK